MNNPFFVHPTAIVEEGAVIGRETRIWHFSHLMSQCRIGERVGIGQNVFIDNKVTVGNGVKIQNNVSIYNGVTIEDDAFIGPSVVFTNVINPRSFIERKHEFKKTRIGKGATLGANSTIICGIEIGSYALVGAGSVITSNVKPYALVYGNPARQHGWVSKYAYKLIFNDKGEANCPYSGEQYQLVNDHLQIIN